MSSSPESSAEAGIFIFIFVFIIHCGITDGCAPLVKHAHVRDARP